MLNKKQSVDYLYLLSNKIFQQNAKFHQAHILEYLLKRKMK